MGGVLLLFSSSLYIRNMASEGLGFFRLLLKQKSVATGDSVVCAQRY